MNKLIFMLLIMSLLGGCGSRSSDFPDTESGVENPLPPCPDSPNCVRITQKIPQPLDTAWTSSLESIQEMGPYRLDLSPDEYRIESVFWVVFFQDDMTVQLSEADSSSSYLHIRSASRVGYSDLGVNSRRVGDFLELVQEKIPQ